MKIYRLTIFFVLTAMVVIAVAAIIVNVVVGNLARDNLVRIGEENTARNAAHILEMLRIGHQSHVMPSDATTTSDGAMPGTQPPAEFDLNFLAGPQGLPGTYGSLIHGLNIVKIVLFDAEGHALWSTDVDNLDMAKVKREGSIYWQAAQGEVASKFVLEKTVTDVNGVTRPIDIVETYMPILAAIEGPQIGVLEIYRDVSGDIAIQVREARNRVLFTTIATMGGLFLVLCGFMVVADLMVFRSRKRECPIRETCR